MAYKRLTEYPSQTLLKISGHKAIQSDGDLFGILFSNVNIDKLSNVSGANIEFPSIVSQSLKPFKLSFVYNLGNEDIRSKKCEARYSGNRAYCYDAGYYTLGTYRKGYSYKEIDAQNTFNKVPYYKNSLYSIDNSIVAFDELVQGKTYKGTYTIKRDCNFDGISGSKEVLCGYDTEKDIAYYNTDLNDLKYQRNSIVGTKNYTGYISLNKSNIYVDDSTKEVIDYARPSVDSASINKVFFIDETTILTWTSSIRNQPYNDTIGSYEVYQSINGGDYALIGQPRDAKLEITPRDGTQTLQFKIRARSDKGYWGDYFVTQKFNVTDVVLNEIVLKLGDEWKTGLLQVKDKDNQTWHKKPVIYIKKGNQWVTRKIK